MKRSFNGSALGCDRALSLILLVAIVLLSLVYRAIAGPRKEGVF
jgi:hypothetical protein